MTRRTLAAEYATLLDLLNTHDVTGPFEPNEKCASPVCQVLGRIQRHIDPDGAALQRAAIAAASRPVKAHATNGASH